MVLDVELSDYGCKGNISYDYCKDCGEITFMSEMNIGCEMGESTYEEILDENGNVIGKGYSTKCVNCDLVFAEKSWTEFISSCEMITYDGAYIYYKDECIFEYEMTQKYDNHKYVYNKEFMGETCDDGVRVEVSCEVCDYNNSYVNYGHNYEN